MLNIVELLIPLVLIVLISLPLVKVFKGKISGQSAKTRLITHIVMFFVVIIGSVVFSAGDFSVLAAEETAAAAGGIMGTTAQGLGFISAALATGMSALGAGIAVAAAAPAAIGAFSENEKNFGKSLIFVALGEGVAIYGLLISILIINKL
ncbi:ATP synthase subunit C [Proteiniclasticum sp.]|uniref:ATP synthase subunit C n=1 Tax=Proteiniclasticum sp. TaxID=2053595 RepID=UPI0028966A35|nr:ATP synthase subunit C [Proteiniclasticum sp.]